MSDDDADITGYLLTRDGTTEIGVDAGQSSFTDTGLDPETEYCYTITARYTDRDDTDFDSDPSTEACATTDALPGVTYTIDTGAFYQPVENRNVMKGGAAVPLKFNILADGVKDTTGDAGLINVFVLRTPCTETSGGTNLIEAYETVATNKSELKWNGDQWVFNWKSPKVTSETCYKVTLEIEDGASVSAEFNLRK